MTSTSSFARLRFRIFIAAEGPLSGRPRPEGGASSHMHLPAFSDPNRLLQCLGCAALLLALGSGCKLGPDYERPPVEVPTDWRWKTAEPRDQIPRGEWWRVFNDPELDALESQAAALNQDLKAAAARVDQARATARLRRADFLPSLEAAPQWQRYRTSGNRPSPVDFPVPSFLQEQWDVPFDLTYEVDLWGKVRRSFESARHLTFANEAARQTILLTLQADVAAHYFSLLSVREELRLLEDAIRIRSEAFGIFEQRLNAGLGSEFEVQRARVEVASAEADLAATRRREAEIINALAVLCGTPPSSFIPEATGALPPAPPIAPDLPSSLLERRPDVAEAEREMAARNAEIGVAKTAFFPSIQLTGSGGFQSGAIEDLFKWDSRTWSIGPSITVPIFQAGRGGANLKRARALHEESVALYRQRILVAFGEVEDNLAALRFLHDQATARAQAAGSATTAAQLALERYTAGAVNFLEVVDAEAVRLQNELARVRVAQEQLIATVRLVKALGGGWDEPDL
jgi:outer membrane protein, multidrug efflux system